LCVAALTVGATHIIVLTIRGTADDRREGGDE
jgi:hypothetical protein